MSFGVKNPSFYQSLKYCRHKNNTYFTRSKSKPNIFKMSLFLGHMLVLAVSSPTLIVLCFLPIPPCGVDEVGEDSDVQCYCVSSAKSQHSTGLIVAS